MSMTMEQETAVALARAELVRASQQHPEFHSFHEGFAVLKEEVDELWTEVKKNPRKHPERALRCREEAVQVAAMALRFLVDCCKVPNTSVPLVLYARGVGTREDPLFWIQLTQGVSDEGYVAPFSRLSFVYHGDVHEEVKVL